MAMSKENILDTLLASFIIITILVLSCFVFYFEFLCIKKHFPNMTIIEYLFLEDKIRIIPNGDD
jgi:hypothetical protein